MPSKPKAAAETPAALLADDRYYSVTIRLQVGSLAGDPEYHLEMRRSEIAALLSGRATCVRLPRRYGPANEYRFVPLSNIVEITLYDLNWPPAEYIAEAKEA